MTEIMLTDNGSNGADSFQPSAFSSKRSANHPALSGTRGADNRRIKLRADG